MVKATRAPDRAIRFGYRPDLLDSELAGWLDHIRWIAALAVAAGHLRTLIFPDADDIAMSLLVAPFYFLTLYGNQAVVIFFALSGLLVGGSVIRAFKGGRWDPGRYALDRATRLYVVLLPAVALSLLLASTVGGADCEAPDGGLLVLGNLAFLQNFTVEPLCNNSPLWSLSSEAFFYLVGPVMILAVYRRSWKLAGLALLLLAAALPFFTVDRNTPLFGLALWLGGIAPWFVKVRLRWYLALVPLFAILLAGRAHLFPSELIEHSLLVLAFALLLCSDFDRVRVPPPGLATALAAFSYSLYLVHMPVAQAVTVAIGRQALDPYDLHSYAIYGAILAAIMAASWLFSQVFERHTGVLRGWLLDLSARRYGRRD